MEGFGLIWADWTKMHLKKIWKRYKEIKYWKQWMEEIWSNFLNLMPSLYDQESKPNARDWKAAQEALYKTWKIVQKIQIWFQGYKAIRDTKPISIASLGIPERIPININHKSVRNWYLEPQLYQINCIIIHSIICVICEFCLLILVHIEVLKLTSTFNCIFIDHTRLYHDWMLGFPELQIRDS